MRSPWITCLSLAGCALFARARADDLTGAGKLLCAAKSVSACCDDGQCATGMAAELNLPEFVEVDLTAKQVRTTKASGLGRKSPIEGLKRADGKIVFYGIENGRAFSFLVAEDTGELAATIAAEGCSVAVFGSCTPLPAGN